MSGEKGTFQYHVPASPQIRIFTSCSVAIARPINAPGDIECSPQITDPSVFDCYCITQAILILRCACTCTLAPPGPVPDIMLAEVQTVQVACTTLYHPTAPAPPLHHLHRLCTPAPPLHLSNHHVLHFLHPTPQS